MAGLSIDRAHQIRNRRPSPGRLQVSMKRALTTLTAAVATTLVLLPVAAGAGATTSAARVAAVAPSLDNRFHQTNLVSDLATVGAQVVDPNLKNPWGLAASPTGALWVADNNGNVATVYSGAVAGSAISGPKLTVAIPGGAPTGQVYNPTDGFVVSSATGSGPARFIFSSESGQLTGWSPAAGTATAQTAFTSPTAVYKGLAIARGRGGTLLFATNFHDGTVDVFNSRFQPARAPFGFRDAALPSGYAPFGIQENRGLLYVSYAQQNAERHDDVKGPGHGYIDIFTPDGLLVRRLASGGALDSPWGMAVAPAGFGPFSGDLLVGNFGDGHISVFGQFSGQFSGQLQDESHMPVTIDGLWGLRFGNASTGGAGTLLFSAGINDEQDGLLGAQNGAG